MTNEEFIKSVSLDGEIWKDVVDYEGKYWISSFGRVVANSMRCGLCILVGEKPNTTGYIRVDLYRNSKRKRIYIHRLVASHFVDNPNSLNEVDHIDGNPTNNHFTNLRWCTHKENMSNPNTLLKQSLSHKGKYNNPKISTPVVQLKNGEIVKIYPSIHEASRFDCSLSSIVQCCKNVYSQHKGYKWMYLSDYENLINKSKNYLPNHD